MTSILLQPLGLQQAALATSACTSYHESISLLILLNERHINIPSPPEFPIFINQPLLPPIHYKLPLVGLVFGR